APGARAARASAEARGTSASECARGSARGRSRAPRRSVARPGHSSSPPRIRGPTTWASHSAQSGHRLAACYDEGMSEEDALIEDAEAPPPKPSEPAPSKSGAPHLALRIVLGMAGLLLVVGFFLPWVQIDREMRS